MATLMHANRQWASRPADERFVSLPAMQSFLATVREQSRQAIVSTRGIEAVASPDFKGLSIGAPDGNLYDPTNWAFGQLSQLAEAPASYLRTLAAPIAADCINFGLRFKREIEDIGILMQSNGTKTLRAATGPRYGRIWNDDVVAALIDRFGDGVTGDWKVPGEFGKDVAVTQKNTTLFASDRDMFVFLADEKNRIEVPDRRNGQPGSLARGFFVSNSEVGKSSLYIGTFLFDYVCCNRIVWGATEYKEVSVRHTASAPDRWVEEVMPALKAYSESSSDNIVRAIEQAKETKLEKDLGEFLKGRFSARMIQGFEAAHVADEDRPIETVWDVVTGITAYARQVENQDARIELETKAGEFLKAA